jgi:hypothetical protein
MPNQRGGYRSFGRRQAVVMLPTIGGGGAQDDM